MKNKTTVHDFGKRLAEFRKSMGLTQEELSKRIGVSRRVIAYYEAESSYPATHLLIPIAKTLKISVDELLGLKRSKVSDPDHASLWRKLKKTEQLSPKDQQVVFSLIKSLSSKYQEKD